MPCLASSGTFARPVMTRCCSWPPLKNDLAYPIPGHSSTQLSSFHAPSDLNPSPTEPDRRLRECPHRVRSRARRHVAARSALQSGLRRQRRQIPLHQPPDRREDRTLPNRQIAARSQAGLSGGRGKIIRADLSDISHVRVARLFARSTERTATNKHEWARIICLHSCAFVRIRAHSWLPSFFRLRARLR